MPALQKQDSARRLGDDAHRLETLLELLSVCREIAFKVPGPELLDHFRQVIRAPDLLKAQLERQAFSIALIGDSAGEHKHCLKRNYNRSH